MSEHDLRESMRIALSNLDAFFDKGEAEELDYVDRARQELRTGLQH